MLTSVKFCGLCRPVDAAAAAASGAGFAGVILSPAGPRAQTAESAASIWAAAGAAVRVGVFVDEPVERVRALATALGLGVVQLHGTEPQPWVEALRGGGWQVWKAIRPRDASDFLESLAAWSGRVDGLLVDGGPAGTGGTGTRFSLEAVEPHRGRVPPAMKLIVAGGLAPGNVGDVVRRLKPDVVDVSSGVEAERCLKSEALMRRFIAEVRAADRRNGGGAD